MPGVEQLQLLDRPVSLPVKKPDSKLDRISNDFYPTDGAYTEIMLDCLPAYFNLQGLTIEEPCAGARDIVRVLEQRGLIVNHSDIADDHRFDATQKDFWQQQKRDVTCTNPPFDVATPILQNALEFSDRGVIFLLPVNYFEPTKNSDGSNKTKGIPPKYDSSLFLERYEWLDIYADNMVWQQIMNPRPLFRQDTSRSDSKTVCWTLWDKQWSWLKLGIEPPWRFSRGARCRDNPRKTNFPTSRPKLEVAA